MSKRILHLIHTPRHSGAEILVRDLCIGFDELNHKSAVASFAPPQDEFLPEIKIFKKANTQLFFPDRNLIKVSRIKQFIKVYKEFKPDIVFAHSELPSIYGRLANIFIKKNFKFVTVLHSATNKDFENSKIENLICNMNDMVVAVSEAGLNHYKNTFNYNKIIQIPNGINLQRYSSIDTKTARQSLNINDLDKIILQVGRISEVKGQIHSLELLKELLKFNPNYKLWLAGLTEDSNYLHLLNEYIKNNNLEDNVSFLGSREDIPELLAASNLYLMPSYAEAQGIALIEALASGIPIISSDIEQFKYAKNMPLVYQTKPNEMYKVANKVNDIINNRENRIKLLSHLSIDETIKKYENIVLS